MTGIASIIALLGGILLWRSAFGDVDRAFPLRIEINIPAYTLTLYSDTTVIRSYPIAVGSPRFQTPTGHYSITEVVIDPWWYPPKDSPWAEGKEVTPPGPTNPLGAVKIPLADGILIHGTGDPQGVRKALSHGCIRLHNADILELAWFLTKRDTAGLATRGKTVGFLLDRPVPVVIRYRTVDREPGLVLLYPDVYGKESRVGKIETILKAEGMDIGAEEAKTLEALLRERPLDIATGRFDAQDLRLLSDAML